MINGYLILITQLNPKYRIIFKERLRDVAKMVAELNKIPGTKVEGTMRVIDGDTKLEEEEAEQYEDCNSR